MSETTTKEPTNVFDLQIQEEADRERENLLSRARSHTREIGRKTDNDIEAYRTSVMDRVRQQAESKLQRIQSQARIDLSRKKLEVQERVFETVFSNAVSQLSQSPAPDFMAMLIAEGILGIGGDEVSVYVPDKDVEAVQNEILHRTEQLLKKKDVPMPATTVKPISKHPRGLQTDQAGVVITSPDGRMEFDNRIQARMDRMENEFRAIAYEKLML